MLAETNCPPATTPTYPQVPVRLILANTDTDTVDQSRIYQWVMPGHLVAPGLAVHATVIHGQPQPGQYSLTHLASGLNLTRHRCATHVEQDITVATSSSIDWTADVDQLRDDSRLQDVHTALSWDLCSSETCDPTEFPSRGHRPATAATAAISAIWGR